MTTKFKCGDFKSDMERKNYCYFNKLISYYKHVLFTDSNENIENCFVENKNTQIFTCLYKGEKVLALKEKLLFKIYPIKRFVLNQYVLKYDNFFDILSSVFNDLLLPIMIYDRTTEEDIKKSINDLCLRISILCLINKEFSYLYLFLLNHYINKSLKTTSNKKIYYENFLQCFNQFKTKIINNPKYVLEYNINIYLLMIMSINPMDNNLFKRLYTVIKNTPENLSEEILLKIEGNIFNNKLSNDVYTASDFLYNYIIYLYDRDQNDANCKIFLDYIFIFLKNHNKTNLRYYQQIIELFINKLNNNVGYFNKLCGNIKDKLYLSSIKNISCKQPLEIKLSDNSQHIVKHNIYCDDYIDNDNKQNNEDDIDTLDKTETANPKKDGLSIDLPNSLCKIKVKDCKIFYTEHLNDEQIEKSHPILLDNHSFSYIPKLNDIQYIENEEQKATKINECNITVNRNKLTNLKAVNENDISDLSNYVYMKEAQKYILNNNNSIHIDDITYFKHNNEILALANLNREKYNYLVIINKYNQKNILKKDIYYKNKFLGKVTQKYINNDGYLYLFNNIDGNICIKLNENNINDINFTDIYIDYNKENTDMCISNNIDTSCYNYEKNKLNEKCCYTSWNKNNKYKEDIDFLVNTYKYTQLLYNPLILNINNVYNNYYLLNNSVFGKNFNFDFKIDYNSLKYKKHIIIDVLKEMYINKGIDSQVNLQNRILNGISYKIIQKENIEEKTKILYYTELKTLFSSNGLFCFKIDTSDTIYDRLILKNMSTNLIVWYLNINKIDSEPISFSLQNYDLYFKYKNNSKLLVINNNYKGSYRNLCKLELDDNGDLKILEPDNNIIWNRSRIYKSQTITLPNYLISSLNGKYLFTIERKIKTDTKTTDTTITDTITTDTTTTDTTITDTTTTDTTTTDTTTTDTTTADTTTADTTTADTTTTDTITQINTNKYTNEYEFILKLNVDNKENKYLDLYKYSCTINDNIVTYDKILNNCSENKVGVCVNSKYLVLNNFGELECVIASRRNTIISNNTLYNYINEKQSNFLKEQKANLLNNIYLDFEIGVGGLGGKTEAGANNSINMFDEDIKKAITHPKVGNNTVLKMQYKTQFKIKHIDLNYEYIIKNKNNTTDVYGLMIMTDNTVNNIQLVLKQNTESETFNGSFIINIKDNTISIKSSQELPFNIKNKTKFRIYENNKDDTLIDITETKFIKHYDEKNINIGTYTNLVKPITCHGGNIFDLNNISIDKTYYNLYKSEDLIYVNNINLDNRGNISESQLKMYGAGGAGGVVGNSEINNKVNNYKRPYNGGFTKEINLNNYLKVYFNSTEDIIKINSSIEATSGPSGGNGGYIDLVSDTEKKINGKNGMGIGSGGGGGARYIENANKYYLGRGGSGSKGGAFIITCNYNNNDLLEINNIRKINLGDTSKINLGKLFKSSKTSNKIAHIYILLIGAGGGGAVQGYGGNAGNLLVCSINKNIENLLYIKDECSNYNTYVKHNYMNIIFNKLKSFNFYNIPNGSEYILKNIFYKNTIKITFNSTSFELFTSTDFNKTKVTNFTLKNQDNSIILDNMNGVFNYNNKTNSLSIYYKTSGSELIYYKFNKGDIDPYQWQLIENKDSCTNNITNQNSLYFTYFTPKTDIYYNIDSKSFDCENIFNKHKDWDYSNFVHNKKGDISLKYILIECVINNDTYKLKNQEYPIIRNNESCHNTYTTTVILRIFQFYVNKVYIYKAFLLNNNNNNIYNIINKKILFKKNQNYVIRNIYRASNNLALTSITNKFPFNNDYISMNFDMLYFIDNNNLCNKLIKRNDINSSFYSYIVYSQSQKLKDIITDDNKIDTEIYIKNINKTYNIFRVKIQKCIKNNIYSVIINSKEIQLSNINVRNDIFKIIDPCSETLNNDKICCPIPDLSPQRSCNLNGDELFCQFGEISECPDNYLSVINVHHTIKQYFLYYKYNIGTIQEGAMIESIISNRVNNNNKKSYINLNINNHFIKNEMYKNNTLFDILKDDKNPISFISYLSNKHTNKVLVKKIYTIDSNDKEEEEEEEYELSSSIDNLNVLEFSKKIKDIPVIESTTLGTTAPKAPTKTSPKAPTKTAPTKTGTTSPTTTGGNKDKKVNTNSDIVPVNKREETSTRIKKYHTIEYKFTNEPIKLKNIELEVEFEKYYDEKTHTTNFYKNVPVFKFDKQYRSDEYIKNAKDNSLIILLSYVKPSVRSSVLNNYSKIDKIKLLIKCFVSMLSDIEKDCFPSQFINCIQPQKLKSTDDIMKLGCNVLQQPYIQSGSSTKNTSFMDCQEKCKSDPDCAAGFWRPYGDDNTTYDGECLLSNSINNEYKSDCGTACIAFEKKVNNILCSCTDGDDTDTPILQDTDTINSFDDCDNYCKSNITDATIHSKSFYYENAKKDFKKELLNYLNAYKLRKLLREKFDTVTEVDSLTKEVKIDKFEIDVKEYINILEETEVFLEENDDWYNILSNMKSCECNKTIIGIIIHQLIDIIDNDDKIIREIEKIFTKDKDLEKDLVNLYLNKNKIKISNLLVSYIYGNKNDLFRPKFFEYYNTNIKTTSLQDMIILKNITYDILKLKIKLCNKTIISEILFDKKNIELNEARELLDILIKMNNNSTNFNLHRNIIKSSSTINQIVNSSKFNIVTINWKVLNDKYLHDLYPLIEYDTKNSPQDIWFNKTDYFVEDNTTNKSHIVKEIYEYNYITSKWVKYIKTSNKLNNKIKFKSEDISINTEKIANKYIKIIIVYDDLNKNNYELKDTILFNSNKTPDNYYSTFGLNVELLFDPQFIYKNEVKEIKNTELQDKTYKNPLNNYLSLEKEKLIFNSVQINQVLTDFVSNDKLFSFDNRLTILRTFDGPTRELLIKLSKDTTNVNSLVKAIQSNLHSHLEHYGHFINTLDNDHIKNIYNSYKNNYKKNLDKFKLPPNYFEIINTSLPGHFFVKFDIKSIEDLKNISDNFEKDVPITYFKNKIKEDIYTARFLPEYIKIGSFNEVVNTGIETYMTISLLEPTNIIGICTRSRVTKLLKRYKIKYTSIKNPIDSDFITYNDDNIFSHEKNRKHTFNFLQKSINIHHIRIYPITSSDNYKMLFSAILIPENYNLFTRIIGSDKNLEKHFNKGDIISTNIVDTILPSSSNSTYYNHIHNTHSHIDVNTDQFNDDDTEPFEYSTIDTHLHDYHDHKPTNMIAFVIVTLYHSNGQIEFIRQFDNISTSNILDFKYLNRYFKIQKIIVRIERFGKSNCINCKLNIKQLNAFTLSDINDFQVGFVDDISTKLEIFDTININKRVYKKETLNEMLGGNTVNITENTSSNQIKENIINNDNLTNNIVNIDNIDTSSSWCLIDNKCHTDISKTDCITHPKNINNKSDDIYGYGICPNLTNVWCKLNKNGPCHDIRSSNKEWSYLERTEGDENAQNNCIGKVKDKSIDKTTVTGTGLCKPFDTNEGFWCNNILLKECYDWNTYNNIFSKYANFEDHKKECQRINKIDNVEIGQGTCDLNEFEDVYCYDKTNNICFDKYSQDNPFYPLENRKNNAIQNCLDNYTDLSTEDQITVSNRGTCKENKTHSLYI